MNTVSRSIMLIATVALVPAAGALAQTGHHAVRAQVNGSPVAHPVYEYGNDDTNPALTSGRLSKASASVPAFENPTVPGATGETVVEGDNSTIRGDRRATIEQKTGAFEGGGN